MLSSTVGIIVCIIYWVVAIFFSILAAHHVTKVITNATTPTIDTNGRPIAQTTPTTATTSSSSSAVIYSTIAGLMILIPIIYLIAQVPFQWGKSLAGPDKM